MGVKGIQSSHKRKTQYSCDTSTVNPINPIDKCLNLLTHPLHPESLFYLFYYHFLHHHHCLCLWRTHFTVLTFRTPCKLNELRKVLNWSGCHSNWLVGRGQWAPLLMAQNANTIVMCFQLLTMLILLPISGTLNIPKARIVKPKWFIVYLNCGRSVCLLDPLDKRHLLW